MIEKYICEECWSDDIEIRTWYNPNTGDVHEFVDDAEYYICFCNNCQDVTKWRYDYFLFPEDAKKIILKDDPTFEGGTSFNGETLKDFMESENMSYKTPLGEINKALIECGIEPIKLF